MATISSDQPTADRRSHFDGYVWMVLLAVFVSVLFAVLRHITLGSWPFGLDDEEYLASGLKAIGRLPSSLWSLEYFDRGIQRLIPLLWGVSLRAFGSPDGYVVMRTVLIGAYCSSVIPIWIWGRALGLRRALAALVAALSIAVPWAVVSATFLTENLAYPLAAWAGLAIWAAANNPRPVRLVVAAGMIVVAGLARSGMLMLAGVAIVVVGGTWLITTARGGARPNLRWRTAIPIALGCAAVLIVAGGDLVADLAGRYGVGQHPSLGMFWRWLGVSLPKIVAGTGLFPAVLALGAVPAWLRSGDRRLVGLVLMLPAVIVMVAFSTSIAGPDERYLMYAAPPLFLAAGLAVERLDISPVATGVAAALVIALLAQAHWNAAVTGYGYFVGSAESFYARILRDGLHSRLATPGSGTALIAFSLGLVTLAAIVAARRRGLTGVVIALAIGAGLLTMQTAQAVYITHHFATEVAPGGWASVRQESWVDAALPPGEKATFFAARVSPDWDIAATLRKLWMYNRRIDEGLRVRGGARPPKGQIPFVPARIGLADGRITPQPRNRYVVAWVAWPVAPLAGRTLAGRDGMVLQQLPDGPARVRWLVTGTDGAGWVLTGHGARLRVFTAAGRRACMRLSLIGAGDGSEPGWQVKAGGASATVGQRTAAQVVAVAERGRPGGPPLLSIHVRAGGGQAVAPGSRAVQIAGVARVACTTASAQSGDH